PAARAAVSGPPGADARCPEWTASSRGRRKYAACASHQQSAGAGQWTRTLRCQLGRQPFAGIDPQARPLNMLVIRDIAVLGLDVVRVPSSLISSIWLARTSACRSLARAYCSENSGKSYGFRTFRTLELAFYHSLGKQPEPESTHEFF